MRFEAVLTRDLRKNLLWSSFLSLKMCLSSGWCGKDLSSGIPVTIDAPMRGNNRSNYCSYEKEDKGSTQRRVNPRETQRMEMVQMTSCPLDHTLPEAGPMLNSAVVGANIYSLGLDSI